MCTRTRTHVGACRPPAPTHAGDWRWRVALAGVALVHGSLECVRGVWQAGVTVSASPAKLGVTMTKAFNEFYGK